jgi:hypothetical protein
VPDVSPRSLTRPGVFIWAHGWPNPIRRQSAPFPGQFHQFHRVELCQQSPKWTLRVRSKVDPFQDDRQRGTA